MPVGDDWGAEPESIYGLLHTEIDGKLVREKYPSLKGHYGEYYNSIYQTMVNGKPSNFLSSISLTQSGHLKPAKM